MQEMASDYVHARARWLPRAYLPPLVGVALIFSSAFLALRCAGDSDDSQLADDGSFIAGRAGERAIRLRTDGQSQPKFISIPGAVSGGALDMSGDGTVVVGNGTSSAGIEIPFIWVEGYEPAIDLNGLLRLFGRPDGWQLQSANAVSGDGLTVVGTGEDGFDVALIPLTLEHTTLGEKAVGDQVNIEVDVLGKYVKQYLDRIAPAG